MTTQFRPQTGRMNSWLFLVGALVAGTFIVFEGFGSTLFEKALGESEESPVLVFVIPDIENARRVRESVTSDRIVWEGHAGLALVGGRVVALDLDRAGEVIGKAGWVERSIQIVTLDDPRTSDSASGGGSPGDSERVARLREIVKKPELNRSEQMAVLTAMRDGVEF